MFQRIVGFFRGEITTLEVDNKGKATDKDMQVATAVLLLEMAGTDNDYAPEEVRAAFSVLEAQFGISDAKALEILEQADTIRQEKGKIDEFIKSINQNFSTKQKQLVYAMIWRIIVADGKVEQFESRLAKQMQLRLQLTPEQAEAAEELVIKGSV